MINYRTTLLLALLALLPLLLVACGKGKGGGYLLLVDVPREVVDGRVKVIRVSFESVGLRRLTVEG